MIITHSGRRRIERCSLNTSYIFLWVVFFSLFHNSYGQLIFRELPNYKIRSADNIFFDITETRSIIPLNGKWKVHPADDEKVPNVNVSVPSIFEGEGNLIFEKEFSLSSKQIIENAMEIVFFSINYTADISLNNIIIYRHTGGEYPFKIELPRDVLRSDSLNILSVKLSYKLDSKYTIPAKQRYLYPQNFGGIPGDVYIHLKPDVFVSKTKVESALSNDLKSAAINIQALVKNNKLRGNVVIPEEPAEYSINIILADEKGGVVNKPSKYSFTLERNKEINIKQSLKIDSPVLWSPENPNSYILRIEILKSDSVIDITQQSLAVYKLVSEKESIKFNGKDFQLKGVTYFPSNNIFGRLVPYDQMENDITLIRDAGFNCVRFAKSVPHPYYLRLCEQYGLLAFIELPINGVPSGILQEQSYLVRAKDFLSNYINFYSDFPALAGIGLGSGYLPELESHISLISNLVAAMKEKSKLLTYASFYNFLLVEIEGLDLYGMEFMNKEVPDADEKIKHLQEELGKGRIFISDAAYPVNVGSTDGYVNKYSFEAQAKYFEGLFTYIEENGIPAFFINSMIDYRGDYTSLISGYSETNLYRIGLLDENRSTNRIAYKVVHSKLNNLDKVTIPIGSKRDDAPMEFIVFGLVLAIFMGILVNSGRKFREDASRALLRPYNFFSDVRDQRIISAYHTTLLGLIIAAVTGLVISNLLFFLKTSLFFEQILLTFASPAFINAISYLAWHPLISLFWLTLLMIVLMVIASIVIKIASLFVRTRVYIISIYFTVIWSLLPLVLLIPVGIILYRVLVSQVINQYILIGLLLFIGWIIYRMMKGIYVLFDTNPGKVYFYSILFMIIVFGGILFYFELESSTVQYLLFTLQQFNVL